MASSLSLYALAECLYTGATFHWLDVEDAARASTFIDSARIEHLTSTPSLLDIMARRAAWGWESIETVVCGGAGVAPEQRQRILVAAPACTLFEYYGASELSLVTVKKTAPGGSLEEDSVGTAFPGVDVQIRSSADGPDTVWVKTDTVCRGYFDGEVPLMHDNGWFTVGYQGTLDQLGRLRLRGRSSGMILSAGLNVYPEEVETALSAVGLPGSCVVGRPHAVRGAQLVAVLPADVALGRSRHDLMDQLRLKLVPGAVPDCYMVMSRLPLLLGANWTAAAS
ncbi:acyl-CoA synthetase (AMP-forming)/AMP-acid ligase II [Arthrobacter roseus]|nr:acyl-CoA synthetase (AMP-forming)/AMP-acid ligase II [Arthrobacter roseus]